MYTKELDKFVIENEAEILRMPHFHLGKYLLIFAFIALKAKKQTASENFMKGLLLQSLLTFTYVLFPAFIFLGIGSGISIIVFIGEHLILKYCQASAHTAIQTF